MGTRGEVQPGRELSPAVRVSLGRLRSSRGQRSGARTSKLKSRRRHIDTATKVNPAGS